MGRTCGLALCLCSLRAAPKNARLPGRCAIQGVRWRKGWLSSEVRIAGPWLDEPPLRVRIAQDGASPFC